MTMRGGVHFLKRVGKEFGRNLTRFSSHYRRN